MNRHLSFIIFAFGLITSGILVVNAQTTTVPQPQNGNLSNIAFPIPELGNCADQNSCKSYCDKPTNTSACLDFAKSHNLMRSDDVDRARKMNDLLKNGGPGGCTSRDQCEAYCEKPSNTEQCIAFAEKSGMLNGKELEDAKRVIPFIANGETPGACKTKDECQNYCADSAHTLECISFAEKAGLISKEDADTARKTGGKGPGGCNSKESCDAFCNTKENQDVCFAFAERHGLIKPEELQNIKEGMSRLRMGLSQFPNEVVQCLKAKLGADAVGKIESGQMAPNKELGDTIKNCFEEFKPKMQEKIQEGLKLAPPEVLSCLNSALTPEEFQKMKEGTIDSPEKGDKVKTCFEGMRAAATEQMKKGLGRLNQLPAAVRDCVKEKLGSDTFNALLSGDSEKIKNINQTDIQSAVANCMSSFRPRGLPENIKIPEGTQNIPSPEQIKQMMERGLEGGQTPEGFPQNIPQGGPTSEQIQKMMQQQTPQGVPSSIQSAPTPEQIQQMIGGGTIPLGGFPVQGIAPIAPTAPVAPR